MNLQENIQRIKSMMGLLMENKENKPSTIILVGPQGVGKSTLSKALSEKLNIPVIGSDDFIDQGNWSSEETWSKGWEVRKKNEFEGMISFLNKNLGNNVILDIGGSHGVWEGDHLNKIMSMISSYPNRFLIVPSENEKENTEFLRSRLLKRELDSLPSNIEYWDAVLNGDESFGDKFDKNDKENFLERIKLVKSDSKYKNMALSQRNSNKERYEALSNNPEYMTYKNSPEQKFDFDVNKIEDYSKFFIDNMKNSGIANYTIHNKGKDTKELVDEIITKLT
jgi:GTPase SAR1 family protein